MLNLANSLQNLLERLTAPIDFLAPLLLRLYLAPVFWEAGLRKFNNFDGTAAWFGGALGMPFPQVMAFLATAAELAGGVLLLLGLATRWISISLMVTMLVAMFTAHWHNGWAAIAPRASEFFSSERTEGAIDRLDRAQAILREHGNYGWLTENGSFVVLNNGIEFAATYFVMLLALLYLGGGRYLSLDHWLKVRFGQ